MMKQLVPALALCLASCTPSGPEAPEEKAAERIGVIYVFHGGTIEHSDRSSWNATMQIFAYDPNSPVFQRIIWNPQAWPRMTQMGNSPKERQKYAFEYERIGGRDSADDSFRARYEALKTHLESREAELGVDFVVDYASWLSEDPSHHIHPRSIYEPRVEGGAKLTYCGSAADGGVGPDGIWPGCEAERFNTDGTAQRLLKQGVDRIVMIDMTTSGVRFFKSFDVVNLARQVVADYNAEHGTSVTVGWVNDPTDLMNASYPELPVGWTRALGRPEKDRPVPLEGRPNPVSEDPRLAGFHITGIEARLRSDVPAAKTGIMLVNHATRDNDHYYDPKIDDTVVLNNNIKAQLLERHPELSPDNVVFAWMGRKEEREDLPRPERTRRMRGENLGDAWLYETEREFPADNYLYWDALDRLRAAGVEHIVVAFPQIMVDSVLNLVELPNQIAKEIGFKNWVEFGTLDFDTYPGIGHPFTEMWGMWVRRDCPAGDGTDATVPCCFTMGGCADGRPYPPPRLTPMDEVRDDLDPSLAFAVSEFGHLGYDPAQGAPDPERPVQDQYTGTWALWQPPTSDPGVAEFLADHVVDYVSKPQTPATDPIPL